MITGKINKSAILILIAFAVGWFSLYSIINFHQHRISGEELKYNVYPSLCKKEENLAHTFKTQNDSEVQLENNILFTHSFISILAPEQNCTELHFAPDHICLLIKAISQDRLRGPPSIS